MIKARIQDKALLISVNHLWKGAAAILIARDILTIALKKGLKNANVFLIDEKMIKEDEATD